MSSLPHCSICSEPNPYCSRCAQLSQIPQSSPLAHVAQQVTSAVPFNGMPGSCANCSYLSFPSAPTCQYCHAPRPIQQNSHLAALAQHAASAAAPAFGFPAHLPFSNAPASAAAPQGFPASAAQFPGLMPQQPHFPHPGADFSASVQPSEGPYSLGFGRLDPALATRSERLAPRGSGQIENKSDEACVSMMESVPGSYLISHTREELPGELFVLKFFIMNKQGKHQKFFIGTSEKPKNELCITLYNAAKGIIKTMKGPRVMMELVDTPGPNESDDDFLRRVTNREIRKYFGHSFFEADGPFHQLFDAAIGNPPLPSHRW